MIPGNFGRVFKRSLTGTEHHQAFIRERVMTTNATFGRRASPLTKPAAKPVRTRAEQPVRAEPLAPEPLPADGLIAPIADMPSLEDELREWKKNRKSGFEIPWRQISFMASLCFGIASFVLPDSTNDLVNWLLYGLMAISFVVGITRRRRKRADAANAA
jgi:hypothetical protein